MIDRKLGGKRRLNFWNNRKRWDGNQLYKQSMGGLHIYFHFSQPNQYTVQQNRSINSAFRRELFSICLMRFSFWWKFDANQVRHIPRFTFRRRVKNQTNSHFNNQSTHRKVNQYDSLPES